LPLDFGSPTGTPLEITGIVTTRMRRRRTGAALAALTVMLMLSTWWAAGTADAAQLVTARLAFAFPVTSVWLDGWPPTSVQGDAAVIALVGSTLIALAASVRRVS
jgi:hypothetical protein